MARAAAVTRPGKPQRTQTPSAGPGTDHDPRRAPLRAAITARQTEEKRLTALEAAQSRAREQLRHAEAKSSDATDALQEARREEKSRLAYAFVNDDGTQDDPVAAAQAAVNAARSEVEKLDKVEQALAGEIDQAQYDLRDLRARQYAAMAELTVNSAEYQRLVEQHTAAWRRLRSVKTALKAVSAGLHGCTPQKWLDEAHRSETLECDRIGHPIDPEIVNAWSAAMAALVDDPDAALPTPP